MNVARWLLEKFMGVVVLTGLLVLAGIIVLPSWGQTYGNEAAVQAGSELTQDPATINHNTWRTGVPLPTARMGATAGAIGGKIYVVGGYNNSVVLGVNEVYNPTKNTWTTGTSDPNPRSYTASAVWNKVLYMFGGSNGSEILDLTESFNPATKTWTTLAPMPYTQQGATAVVENGVIYVIGGRNITGASLTNVASYHPTTNTWVEEASLSVEKYYSAAGLLGATVVAADGLDSSGYLGDNESYSPTKNAWSELPGDPTPRIVACWGAISGKLYAVGGNDNHGNLLTLNESYTGKTKTWATLAPMPTGIWFAAASATNAGKLYCFGGGVYQQSVNNNVQIYQP